MLNPDQLDAIARMAGQKIGASPEEIKKAASAESAEKLMSSLSDSDKAKLQKVLSDKQATQRILATPQAQALLKKLMQGNQ